MAFVTPLLTGASLAVFTIVLSCLEKARSEKTDGAIKDLRSELKDFRSEVRAELSQIRTEMPVMRSDLTRVALAIGVQPRPEAG